MATPSRRTPRTSGRSPRRRFDTLYPNKVLEAGLEGMQLANALQHLSTIAGAIAVWLWLRKTAQNAPLRRPTALPHQPREQVLSAGAMMVGIIAMLWLQQPRSTAPWLLFWTTTQGALLGFTLVAAVRRRRPMS